MTLAYVTDFVKKNQTVLILIFLMAWTYMICKGAKRENWGGASWFPYGYMKDINQTLPAYDDMLETPAFQFFDNGNRFADINEVDSLSSSVNDLRMFRASNDSHFMTQLDSLSKRGGNA